MGIVNLTLPPGHIGLTDAQRKAVVHGDGPILVIAGPGSGKTRVITCRIAALVNSGVSAKNICAITFTNKAAEQMRLRVVSLVGTTGTHISTFHSLCVRILRNYGDLVAVGANFSIYDESDQQRCVRDAVKASQLDTTNFPPARILEVISRLKNELQTPEMFSETADDYFSKAAAGIYRHYQKILSDNNALDFDDLLFKTATLLDGWPDVRQQLSDRFRYLLIDEYQDTNHAQYRIAGLLAAAHGNICVTGDPDQSIYRWRGADISNILAFEKDWPGAVVVRLEENFRSTPNILAMADMLIANNTKRKIKKLVPTKPAGAEVVIESVADETEESEYIADCVAELIQKGTDASEIAVFYRVNSMSRCVEEAFIRRRLPYQIVRGVEFYARREIRDILGYLKLLTNPQDNTAFLRAISTHPRGIGKTTLDKLQGYSGSADNSLYHLCRHAADITTIGRAAQAKLTDFITMMEGLKSHIDGPVAPLMERVFEQTGLGAYLHSTGAEGLAAVENISELINAASLYDQQTEAPSLLDYLQTIALYSDSDAYEPAGGRVCLMTLHTAKGLEFDNVFILGLEDGILPHERSCDSQDDMEEERRLFFVGMTRTRQNLAISFARYRTVHGQLTRTTASPFLYEIGFSGSEGFSYDPGENPSVSFQSGPSRFGRRRKQYDRRQRDNQHERFDDYTPAPDPDTDGEVNAFLVNEVVMHGKFGIGKVLEFHNVGDNSTIVIRFGSGVTKSFMVKYAGLTRLSR